MNKSYFNARIAGNTNEVDKAFDFIKTHSLDVMIYDENTSSEYEKDISVEGACEHSVCVAWNVDKYASTTKVSASEGLQQIVDEINEESAEADSIMDIKGNVSIEVFAEENDVGFQEHYLIKNNTLLINDEREYSEDDTPEGTRQVGGYATWDLDFNENKVIPECNME